MDQDKCNTVLQKYEKELRHFGKSHTNSEVSEELSCPQINGKNGCVSFVLTCGGFLFQLHWSFYFLLLIRTTLIPKLSFCCVVFALILVLRVVILLCCAYFNKK